MQSNLSDQSREILENRLALRKSLSQIFPADIIEYVIELIVRDQAHQKFLELIKD